MFKLLPKKKLIKYLILSFAGVIILSLLSFSGYSVALAKKIYANQYLGDLNLGGKSKAEAAGIIHDRTGDFINSDFSLTVPPSGKKYTIDSTEIGLNFDEQKTLDKIWQTGRGQNALLAFKEQFLSIFVRNHHPAVYSISDNGLSAKIESIASDIDQPEKDFSLVYSDGKFTLSSDRAPGRRLDQSKIVDEIKGQIENERIADIWLTTDSYSPQISEKTANDCLAQANTIIKSGDLTLKLLSQEYKVDTDSIGGFVVSVTDDSNMTIGFNDDRLQKYVAALASGIDVEPANAKLAATNGTVVVAMPSRKGTVLNQAQTILDIKNSVLSRINPEMTKADPKIVNLVANIKDPDISEANISSYGIKELVGTATTSFYNSPSNRVHNITIGANALNGIILKPGETFSTLGHLGKIDASTGYLQELVIKNNKTVPDFGGGLCQVSSTLFRSALNSGMQIVERQNHAYRVSYYEPPVGMDATIYDPSPDFKFTNNYSTYILIQSRIEGTKISFDFYGTKDGRKIEMSVPVVTDVVAPPPPIYVETDTLALGQTKRTDSGHPGATANFDYKVTSANGDILQSKTFKSVYVPWQERWLVGKGTNVPATCSNGAQDGDETGVDCGGSCPKQCPA